MLTSKMVQGSLAALFLLGAPVTGVALAQQPEPAQAPQATLSDAQIDSFVSAYQSIQVIRQETQAELIAAVEAEGLTVEEFNTIAEVQQSPEATSAVAPDEAEKFNAAVEQLSVIQAEAQAEIEAAIEAERLTVEEFEQILALAQQDPALRAEITQRLSVE